MEGWGWCGGCGGSGEARETSLTGTKLLRRGEGRLLQAKAAFETQKPGETLGDIVSVLLMDREQQVALRSLARDHDGGCSIASADGSMAFWTCAEGHSWWASPIEVGHS